MNRSPWTSQTRVLIKLASPPNTCRSIRVFLQKLGTCSRGFLMAPAKCIRAILYSPESNLSSSVLEETENYHEMTYVNTSSKGCQAVRGPTTLDSHCSSCVSFSNIVKSHTSFCKMIPGEFQNQKPKDRLDTLLKAKKEREYRYYIWLLQQLKVYLISLAPTLCHDPVFRYITSGFSFKLFIRMKVNCGLCLVGKTLKSQWKIEKEAKMAQRNRRLEIEKAEAINLFMQNLQGHFSLDFSQEWPVNPYARKVQRILTGLHANDLLKILKFKRE